MRGDYPTFKDNGRKERQEDYPTAVARLQWHIFICVITILENTVGGHGHYSEYYISLMLTYGIDLGLAYPMESSLLHSFMTAKR